MTIREKKRSRKVILPMVIRMAKIYKKIGCSVDSHRN